MSNEPTSAITHLIGACLAITALVLMVVFASLKASVWHIVSFSIFGTTMILLYLASTIYHFIPISSVRKKLFQKLDHSMIYLLIAGTYTPVCLTVIRGGWGWSLFGIIWAMAIFGILMRLIPLRVGDVFATIYYGVMGWLIVIAIKPLAVILPMAGLFWLGFGGVMYTIGIIFFALDQKVKRSRWFGMHEIFHLFVIAGSFSHFWLMIRYVLYL
jgi:hemolysin III